MSQVIQSFIKVILDHQFNIDKRKASSDLIFLK